MEQQIQFKKDVTPPPVSFANLASSVLVSNRAKLVIETADEICVHYNEIAFRILIWGQRNTAKTHFLLTCPEPICVIDTEDRAKLIMPKFRTCKDCGKQWVASDKHPKSTTNKICGIKECPHCGSTNIRIKDIRKIRVINSQQARDAAKVFIEVLDKHYKETGTVGTIGVDNISKIWDWVQNEYGAGKGLNVTDRLSPRDDYKHINPQHNENFRDIILQCIYNVVLIATAKPIYDKEDQYKITGTGAEGQKHNTFAVDWEIYNSEGEVLLKDGKTVGNGVFTSYILKNSIAPGMINPIQYMDFDKLVKIREKLLIECGVSELPKPPDLEPEKLKEVIQ